MGAEKPAEGEIEVTPEMVEAGGVELAWRGDWSRSDDEVLTRIYRAMELARRQRLAVGVAGKDSDAS